MKFSVILTTVIIMMTSFCNPAKAAPAPDPLTESAQELKMSANRNNPGVLNFSIPSSSIKKVQFTIYNGAGVVILSEERAASDLQVDIKALKADGTYIFSVVAAGKIYSSKVLIML